MPSRYPSVGTLLIGALFLLGVVLLQLEEPWWTSLWVLVWLVGWIFLPRITPSTTVEQHRQSLTTILLFAVGFVAYLMATQVLAEWLSEQIWEVRIFLNRLLLILIVIPLAMQAQWAGLPFLRYGLRPNWRGVIAFPFIWHGFHRVPIRVFLPIALVINVVSFFPFFLQQTPAFFQTVWVGALLFALANSILEEVIWRGVLFSRLAEQLGEPAAIIFTSLGFGLQHYSLGWSWSACLGSALGGFFYAGITVRSGSIVPALLWHFVLNLLMAFGGLILTRQ